MFWGGVEDQASTIYRQEIVCKLLTGHDCFQRCGTWFSSHWDGPSIIHPHRDHTKKEERSGMPFLPHTCLALYTLLLLLLSSPCCLSDKPSSRLNWHAFLDPNVGPSPWSLPLHKRIRQIKWFFFLLLFCPYEDYHKPLDAQAKEAHSRWADGVCSPP